MVKKPYIKKFKEIADFTVWIVDGCYIREHIDEEFTNYGQHYRFKFIPKNELWIDRARKSGEEKYYIDSMLVMHRLIAEGISHNKAAKIADKIEQRERAKSELMQQELKIKNDNQKLLDSIHEKLLKNYSKNGINVWVVNGEAVRDLFFLDFVEGGHSYIYPFIPKNEVWIEDDVKSKEIKYVLLHELHERNLMAKGWCYDVDTSANLKTGTIKKGAHPDSSRIEYYCRLHPKETEKKIAMEIKPAKS
ncbi:MAG: hypothetical protein Q8N88_03815 [Nanoarchaeota archaeon]|nr:hypothetical protein [Nanoarchaeota archaeon]